MIHRHRAFGIGIASEIALPELPGAAFDTPGLVIARRAVAPPPGAETLVWGNADDIRFAVPGIARFAVRPDKIAVDPTPGTDEASLRVFLLGSALGAALCQRNHVTLRGAAVAIDGKGVTLLGEPAVGKSALAVALGQAGHPILADDLIAVGPGHDILPGVTRGRVWRDMAVALGLDVGRLAPLRPGLGKYLCGAPASPPAAPLHGIYIIDPQPVDRVRLEPLHGFERAMWLRRQSYRAVFDALTGGPRVLLPRLAALAGAARMVRLIRPLDGVGPAALAGALLQDLRGHD